jgi:hypothetical protein
VSSKSSSALCRGPKETSEPTKPEEGRVAAESNDNPQPLEVRQNIANIAVFVMERTIDMQINPDPAKLKSLIDINCNLAAGLSGRG